MKYFIPLVLVGCASSLTPEEIEYRDNENAAKWEMCKAIYKEHGVATVSHHAHGPNKKHKAWEVREDLVLNRCRQILKDVWD